MSHAVTELPETPLPGADADGSLPQAVALAYDRYFDFVWRNARRLGVAEAALDDVVQDVFLVVCRRLAEFEGRSSMETWLFGILSHVVLHRRRSEQRRGARIAELDDPSALEELPALEQTSPDDVTARHQAARLIHRVLEALDDDKRSAYVLVELEQVAPLELARASGVNVNTIHARLRAARQHMEQGVARHLAREKWRVP